MDKKRMVFSFRVVSISIFLLILTILPFASANILDYIADYVRNTDDWITGYATTATSTLNITVGNTAPVVDSVSPIPTQSITEAASTQVVFYFTATDTDGVANLDDTKILAQFNRSGEDFRGNNSCSLVGDLDSDTANYSCTIYIWYWDANGVWTVNATAFDTQGAAGSNLTTNFSLGQSTNMKMAPTSLTWPSISLTSTNQTSNNDPIVVNNTGNKDIADGSLTVTAINLRGEATTSQYLNVSNFTIDIDTGGTPAAECDGTKMVNGTATGITGATLNAGNHSVGAGQGNRSLYFCLVQVTAGTTQQSYSTAAGGTWTVTVS